MRDKRIELAYDKKICTTMGETTKTGAKSHIYPLKTRGSSSATSPAR